MSPLIISALAAATLTAVPPSIGSEPVPANFDDQPTAAKHVAYLAPDLAVSLGSEPTFVQMDASAPRVLHPGQHTAAPATLAASLGSEPFIAGFDENATPGTPRSDERRSELAAVDATVARWAAKLGDEANERARTSDPVTTGVVSAPLAELDALLAWQRPDGPPRPDVNDSAHHDHAMVVERSRGTHECTCMR